MKRTVHRVGGSEATFSLFGTPAPITWRTGDLSRARIESIFGGGALGKKWVADILARPKAEALAYCVSRKRGAFDANDREHHAAYASLCRMIDPAGSVRVAMDNT